jgi:uncharacterized protein
MALAPDSLIDYPCDFPIKVMGRTQSDFAQEMLRVIRMHAPDFDGATMTMKTSKGAKYLSVTCVIRATSREQLDALYQALCDHPMVVMAL